MRNCILTLVHPVDDCSQPCRFLLTIVHLKFVKSSASIVFSADRLYVFSSRVNYIICSDDVIMLHDVISCDVTNMCNVDSLYRVG